MKNLLFIWGMIFISFPLFSQKNELRQAEQMVNRKNDQQALQILQQLSANVDHYSDDLKSQYYYLYAITSLRALDTIDANEKEVELIIQSFNKVKESEIKTKSRKYTDKIEPVVGTVLAALVNRGIALNESGHYLAASKSFNQAYQLNTKDTTYLFYAAGAALNGKDYDFAENRYKELIKLKYNGTSKIYTALNLSSNKVESFGSDRKMRDALVRQDSHSDPKTIEEPSKRGEIYKNLAFILMQKENFSEAEDYLLSAHKENKKDEAVLLALMELYLKTNRLDMYDKFAKLTLETHPDRKVVLYNLGIVSFQKQDYEAAKAYFTKATRGKNASDNAYLMLANIALLQDATLTNQLNDLSQNPNSSAYKELYEKKRVMYNEAASYLTEALKINNDNLQAQDLLTEIEAFLAR